MSELQEEEIYCLLAKELIESRLAVEPTQARISHLASAIQAVDEMGDKAKVADDIKITILGVTNGRVDLGFNAPKGIDIVKDELDVENHPTDSSNNEFQSSTAHEVDDGVPSFKPGKTPHLHYGKDILNADVKWNEIVLEIMNNGTDAQSIAAQIDVALEVVLDIVEGGYSSLDFKTGAKLCSLHCNFCPDKYGF
jgi:carbon storage regulator CsrA